MRGKYLFEEDDKMSDKDVELEIDGKGNIRIPWKVVLIVLGLVGAALGIGEDVFQSILDTVEG
tara:strand:- start:2 stop:190 length:189 start_codon:yes stop_codon:yes gene_type:complete